MKFGKEFKKQKVPEWTEAYMDYNGLKRILREIKHNKRSTQPSTPLRTLQHKLTLHKPFSGLNLQSFNAPSEGDIEDQVIDISTLQKDGTREIYQTYFLKQCEEGGDIEVMFFRKLDAELNKVNTFYKDKIGEMLHEACVLSKQMDALIALRIKVEKTRVKSINTNTSCPHDDVAAYPLRKIGSSKNTSGKEHKELALDMDRSSDYDSEVSTSSPEVDKVHAPSCKSTWHEKGSINYYEKDPLRILDHVKISNTLESPLSTIKGVFKDSKDEELSFKKVELRKVEERLKVVFIEFYQKLCHLKHYSYMNLAAFSKILKKYEKITSRRVSRLYMEVVDDSCLGSSDEITGLLERVEGTFIKHFSNSNRREGMKSLRPKTKREKHSITFISGFFSGCSIALLVAVVLRIQARKLMEKPEGASYMVNIFPLYSLFGYIVLHMFMYAANIYFWKCYRVNYTFIFGFKQGTELCHREVFLLSNGLLVLALASFLANLHLDLGAKDSGNKTVTELVPVGLVTVVLGVLFCPFDIIFHSSRFFFIHCFFRCICAPFYKVRLPDFFLADHLASQVQAIRSLELYICYYSLGEYSMRQNKCHSHGIYTVFYFIIAVIPFWLRFLQCLRRFFEDRDIKHGYNGSKYFLTIVAILFRTAFELKKGRTWLVLALVSSALATMMNTYWDIVVDWGLLRRKSKNPYLRDKLVISHKSVYFAAMVLNALLRLAWLELVLEFNLRSLHKMAASTIIACLEIIRRGIWSFFRLENEHLNNVGKYRAFKSVPLPFNYYDTDKDKDD